MQLRIISIGIFLSALLLTHGSGLALTSYMPPWLPRTTTSTQLVDQTANLLICLGVGFGAASMVWPAAEKGASVLAHLLRALAARMVRQLQTKIAPTKSWLSDFRD